MIRAEKRWLSEFAELLYTSAPGQEAALAAFVLLGARDGLVELTYTGLEMHHVTPDQA